MGVGVGAPHLSVSPPHSLLIRRRLEQQPRAELRSAHPTPSLSPLPRRPPRTSAQHNPRSVDGPDSAAKPASAGTLTIEGNFRSLPPALFSLSQLAKEGLYSWTGMDRRVILLGSLVGFLKNRSSSVVTQSELHLLACRRASARPSSRKHRPQTPDEPRHSSPS